MIQFWKYFGIGIKGSKKTILRDQTGFVRDGEMLLVLGRPGAGCTSLLKVLSNIRGAFTRIDGEVSYGGIDHKTFAKYYRGQVIYNEEEDMHYPTLTLKQTLQFALRNKTPGRRLPNETREDFINKILYLLGNMLGLTKQMNTMVGNAFVRGLSGGERKRLSIAEVMTTQSSIWYVMLHIYSNDSSYSNPLCEVFGIVQLEVWTLHPLLTMSVLFES